MEEELPPEETREPEPWTRDGSLCPCKSKATYAGCCRPYHKGKAKPDTAEELMRSRYSAYFFRLPDYLVATTHPDTRSPTLKAEIAKTIHQVTWRFLTVVATAKGQKQDKVGKVEFEAEYFVDGEPFTLHEISRFRRYKGDWKYLDGKAG